MKLKYNKRDTSSLLKPLLSVDDLFLINKGKFILFILILLSFYLDILIFNSYNIVILDDKKVDKLIDNIKINAFALKYNSSCFSTQDNLYWKNQTDLEIEKVRKEINERKTLNLSFENKNFFYKRKKPKISLIITVYNQRIFIKTVYAYIQKQELKDIEIIFVDDASTDNSSSTIMELMKYDKRIVYIKNPSNKKQYYSINVGVLFSKGEYILSIDPDDLLINNILIKAYETAKFYNLDILQFYMLLGMSLWTAVKYKSGIMCTNKNLRNIFYYGLTRNLPDKLIKRNIFLKSITFMKKELYNMDYHMHTDDTIFFGIIHFANSFGFLEQIGYFYNIDPNRFFNKPKKKDDLIIVNENLKSLFNIMKYFIIKSDNITLEKNNIPYKFFDEKVKTYINDVINKISEEFNFYIEVLNLYLNCPFFSKEKKDKINKYKNKILNRKKNFSLNKKNKY